MHLIDSHCHLDSDQFAPDRDAVVAAAQAQGVTQILVPAVRASNFEAVRQCAVRYPACVPAYGIHPFYAAEADHTSLEGLRSWLKKELSGAYPPRALGEIGLDFFILKKEAVGQRTRQLQLNAFVEQLKIARDFQLPVLLHGRSAQEEILQQLRSIFAKNTSPGGIAHAFNGSEQQANAFIKLGFKLGFGGTLSSAKALHIRALAVRLPLESIVLETDAPDMTPVFAVHKRNTPENLPRIAAELATLRGISLAEVAAATSHNLRSVLKLCSSL
ncbi:MAG: TatD family hydrolase [Pseudomonadota bacterium]